MDAFLSQFGGYQYYTTRLTHSASPSFRPSPHHLSAPRYSSTKWPRRTSHQPCRTCWTRSLSSGSFAARFLAALPHTRIRCSYTSIANRWQGWRRYANSLHFTMTNTVHMASHTRKDNHVLLPGHPARPGPRVCPADRTCPPHASVFPPLLTHASRSPVYGPCPQLVRCVWPKVLQGGHQGERLRQPVRDGDRPHERDTGDGRTVYVRVDTSVMKSPRCSDVVSGDQRTLTG